MASREFSAGGVVVRVLHEQLHVAVIKPNGRNTVALPKGHIDPGENAEQAAQREVLEETGVSAVRESLLGEVKYVYRFQGQTVFKVVTFFLFWFGSGEIGDITEAMKIEVERAWWMPLEEAVSRLSFPGEREMAAKALTMVSASTKPPRSTSY